ncbi:MAG: aldo/keto reductase [Caulobacteraceae bacterium]|nr:aldo/keto reductase [Caulobacteraceae bacterium]
MRFRPLGNSGMVVSAVSLILADSPSRPRPQDWEALVYAALENGINAFEVVGRHPAIGEGLAQALQSIERRLICVTWRMGNVIGPGGQILRDFSPDGLQRATEAILARTGFAYLDALVLDEPKADELTPAALERLKALRAAGRTRLLAVAGEDDAIDAYISTGAFDLLCTRYSLVSGWKERMRIRAAIDRDMGVMAYGFHPEIFQRGASLTQAPKTRLGAAPNPLAGAGTYAFLDRTPNWSREAICLAYALTEPSLASVQILADRPDHIQALAEVTELDLPPGASAQIEMARFTVTPGLERGRGA